MATRGDGIGLEITSTVIRGVRLDRAEPGRVAAVCEVPIVRSDDSGDVVDALVRARAQLGGASVTTRAAWFPEGSSMQRFDATGLQSNELNRLRHDLTDRTGITSTMLLDVDARRWMLALRWDHTTAWWWQELIERAGFVDVAIEPAPVALERVIDRRATVARRDAGGGHSWAAVFDGSTPVAATTIESGERPHPSIAVTEESVGVHDLASMLIESELTEEVERLTALALAEVVRSDELGVRLRVLDHPYPPFPAHDLRAPQRVGVALGAAVGAAGLAGRLRPVDVLSPVRPVTQMERPWAIERIPVAEITAEQHRPSLLTRAVVRTRLLFRSGATRN